VISPSPSNYAQGWSTVRLKFFSSRLYGLSQPPEYESDGVPFVRATNVARGRLVKEGLVYVSGDVLREPRTVTLKAGDIVVVRSGAYTGDSALITREWAGGVAGFDIVMKVTRYADPRFVAFSLLSPTVLSRQIEPMSGRAAQPHLNVEELGDVELMLPPLDQQRAIADYLERETARVDALVAAKERVLGLLAEKRRALITRAVTRGLDPRAPFRDSGIPWLGEIPTHWELVALRFLVDIFGGATPNTAKPELWDGDIPWVSPKDMKQEEIADAEDHVSLEALEGSALRLIDPVAVLIVVRGMILAHSFPTATTTRQVTINQDMKALRCRTSLDPHFLRNLFSGLESHLVSLVDSAAHGTRKLETEALGRFEVCVPPMAEQLTIVEYIADSTARLDRLRAATELTISLLKERRDALIAAAVTGQIDVESAA
jgi:type I restriction enzyme S subunit